MQAVQQTTQRRHSGSLPLENRERRDLGMPFVHQSSSARSWKLDAIRGAAVVLMIVDHVVHVGHTFYSWSEGWLLLRLTVTRLALPGFMLVAGYLWAVRGVSFRRLGDVSVAAAAAAGCCWLLRMPLPEVLACYLLAMLASPVVVRWPLPFIIGGFLASMNWQGVFPLWSYQPLYVTAWAAVGVLLCQASGWWIEATEKKKWATPLVVLGQYPLVAYVSHLGLLVVWAYWSAA